MFVDEVKVKLIAGDGGMGCTSFRREKFVPMGGPDGGNGGRGSNIVFVGDKSLKTLVDLRFQKIIKGKKGENGMGSNKYGKNSEGATTKEVHGKQGSFTLDTYTTGEVDAKIITAIQATGAMVLKGELTSTKSLPTTNIAAGDTYIVTADELNVAGNVCEVGDLFVAKADMASGSTDANWYYVPSGNDKHIIIGKTDSTKDHESVGAVLIDGNETASAQYGSINFNSTAA